MNRKPGGVDWTELLRRQEAASAALLEKAVLTPEREQELLKERAAALARRDERRDGHEDTVTCLEFRLSGESYAVEMSYVAETLPLSEFTQVFCTPPFVLGIINVRGRIVSIIDLRRFFELPVVGLSDLNRVIVIGDGIREFGILADAIVGTTAIRPQELQPPPATCTGIREEFLSGITAERLALLDTSKMLADRRVVVHEEVI